MSEGISWFLYIISEFFLYLLAYKVILDAKIEKSFIRWGVCIGGVTVVLVCAVIMAGFSVCEWLTMFVMVSIPLFLLNKDRRIQYFNYVPIYSYGVFFGRCSNVVYICIYDEDRRVLYYRR